MELAIVILILGVLVAVAYPKYIQLGSRAKESEVKSNLGTIRSALALYYSGDEGTYPNLLMSLTFNKKYLGQLETVDIPMSDNGNPGHYRVTGEKNGLAADDTPNVGVWFYVNSGLNKGEVMVNCTHADSKNQIWSTY